jgi:hypothetical protein
MKTGLVTGIYFHRSPKTWGLRATLVRSHRSLQVQCLKAQNVFTISTNIFRTLGLAELQTICTSVRRNGC